MTSPQPGIATGVSTRFVVARAIRMKAKALQHQGLTLTEISDRLGYNREAIIQVLYTEAVRP